MARRPPHRSHDGWIDEVRARPEIPRRVKRLLVTLVENGTYRNKKMNQYAATREVLAGILEISTRNVQRSLVTAVDDGWLVVCVRGQKGRQQVYHRSVPWDPPQRWTVRPCPTCAWRRRDHRLRVDGLVVNSDTGEVQGDETSPYFVSLNVSPSSSPHMAHRPVPETSKNAVFDLSRLVALTSREPSWAGWQAVAGLVPYIREAS